MKKLIPFILFIFIFSSTAFANSNFNDVNNQTFYKQSIDWMLENEIINGYGDGSFKPDNCVNRVELLKMLFKTLEVDTTEYEAELFSDTYANEWYTEYVIAARARGTVNGYPDGTFKPSQCVNRVEAIKMALLEFNNGEIPDQYGMVINPYDIGEMSQDTPWWMPYFKVVISARA